MKELLEKLIAAGKADALKSSETLKAAAAALGYTEEEVERALAEADGLPLDDADLAEIAGGYGRPWKTRQIRP